jgi:hypothetical protein
MVGDSGCVTIFSLLVRNFRKKKNNNNKLIVVIIIKPYHLFFRSWYFTVDLFRFSIFSCTMSNDELQSATSQIQALAKQLEDIRLQLQQQQSASNMEAELDYDPQIVERPVASDLIPTEQLQQALPGMCDDFFRSPLDELDRKRFIHVCPRNVIRQYLPPTLNMADNIGRLTKQTDVQLSEIQRRLAATTRPMDKFLHESLRSNASSVPLSEVILFVNTIHTLVSDSASYITQLRMDNVSRETGLVAPPIPPKTKLTPSPQPLFQDTKAILESTNLHKAVQAATRKPQRRQPNRFRQPHNGVNQQRNHSTSPGDSSNVGQPSSNVTHSNGQQNFRPRRSNSSSHGKNFQRRPNNSNQQ